MPGDVILDMGSIAYAEPVDPVCLYPSFIYKNPAAHLLTLLFCCSTIASGIAAFCVDNNATENVDLKLIGCGVGAFGSLIGAGLTLYHGTKKREPVEETNPLLGNTRTPS